MKPDKEELRRRASLADEILRAIGRRADHVRELAFEQLTSLLPLVRLDLYGTQAAKFHAQAYFATAREAVKLNTGETHSRIQSAIVKALEEVDPSAGPAEIQIEIDSIERADRRGEGYFSKFR